uniref:Uncharacterized protein n=1 Tax=Aegilops tauschii subsp. strangulata TaxID=200361 RepID=A0A453LQI6_AEGTS
MVSHCRTVFGLRTLRFQFGMKNEFPGFRPFTEKSCYSVGKVGLKANFEWV